MAGMTTRLALTFALGAGMLATACSPPLPSPDAQGRVTAEVVEVTDGDTVILDFGGRRESVRLIGVNTPETKHPKKPVECFGPEASARTASLLPPGTEVHVERDVEARDRYERLLVYLRRASDGLFVNLDLAASGHAIPYPFPPNTAHAEEFAAAAVAAEAASLGLWGACPR